MPTITGHSFLITDVQEQRSARDGVCTNHAQFLNYMKSMDFVFGIRLGDGKGLQIIFGRS